MTDRELIIELCRRLGLDRVVDPEQERVTAREYLETPDTIELGAGDGEDGCSIEFAFEEDGSFSGHAIYLFR